MKGEGYEKIETPLTLYQKAGSSCHRGNRWTRCFASSMKKLTEIGGQKTFLQKKREKVCFVCSDRYVTDNMAEFKRTWQVTSDTHFVIFVTYKTG